MDVSNKFLLEQPLINMRRRTAVAGPVTFGDDLIVERDDFSRRVPNKGSKMLKAYPKFPLLCT